jgi:hypothetical protein
MTKFHLCTDEHDPFLDEKAIWIAHLSNGKCVFQDDDRPGINEETLGFRDAHSAWVRMFHYLVEHPEHHIELIRMKFRDHVIRLPHENIAGYYFSRAAMGQWGAPDTLLYNVMGVIRDPKQDYLQQLWYHLPTIEVLQTEQLPRDKWGPPQIIWNLEDMRAEYAEKMGKDIQV